MDGGVADAVSAGASAPQEQAAPQADVEPQAEPAPAAEAAPPRPVFADLGLSDEVLRAVTDAGYLHPTPIQEQAIPIVLMGRDVLGCAQTGTGKTASFTLPMLDIMSSGRARARMPRALILEPTRELAAQVGENFTKYTKYLKFEYALIIGGESMGEQIARLNRGVDVLIATPGRLIDLFERGGLLLTDVRMLVIDEADRMLDMGFIPDVERIVSLLPRMRQTLFFSATMPPEIRRLADAFLMNPKTITVAPPATVASTVAQHLALVREHDKREALRRLLRTEDVKNALVFCNRKRDVDILCKSLLRHGFNAGQLHGDMSQPKRTETLERFKQGELKLLVCSDVAARGIDIGGLSHVFNFDVPFHAEDYVHRIGRTGRAGLSGRAFTLATVEEDEALAAIEKLIGKPIPRIQVEGLDPVSLDVMAERPKARGRGRGRGRTAPAREEKAEAPKREPRRRRSERAPEAAVAAAPEAPEAVMEQPVRARPARPEPVRHEPIRQEPRRRDEHRRDERRPRREAAEDGDRVVGFGEFMPDFMRAPRRAPRPALTDAEDAAA
ncbi:MAG: DEAD/DEAH box helicase [Acetobacteraceae bacterium]|jgi:superfamily II DNA/RNA helicase|nr:DEAD/DEAH box helicase [Acetobacteraceae bacterium]